MTDAGDGAQVWSPQAQKVDVEGAGHPGAGTGMFREKHHGWEGDHTPVGQWV